MIKNQVKLKTIFLLTVQSHPEKKFQTCFNAVQKAVQNKHNKQNNFFFYESGMAMKVWKREK